MLILGIDPGLAVTGYGVVEKQGSLLKPHGYGCIRTEAGTPLEQRLAQIYSEANQIIGKWKPEVIAVEQLFFNRNITSAFAVGQARGVCLLAAAHHQCQFIEYTPLQVKQAVVGNGRAAKQQVGAMVRVLLNLSAIPRPDDVTDALAVAICHCNNNPAIAFPKR
ncbi:MAG: crossover junction endodeoxyribonuclease RuvC [Firmicutes bacterium]|nr:crossover junction endodeoxyribonuclease RuvC [Bacillota bacterium]